MLMDLENKWNDSLLKHDATTLGTFLAESYVSTDEQGHQTAESFTFERFGSQPSSYSNMKRGSSS
jgi:hypothetical protein